MHDSKNYGNIKISKILRWRVELSQYHYEIVYRAEKLNAAADTLSRASCARLFDSSLYDIHAISGYTGNAGLCHPGITRTYHFV